ncbi:hypothetical protein C0584_01425 [Candidatus Parcubacteria bacterium]|nr:MAG: hypothetical protein C0584_01425 [Candidatus Parcubacteria bacterium]
MIKNFDEKLNKLPKDVREYLLFETGSRLERYLIQNYQISSKEYTIGDLLCMVYFGDLSLEKVLDFFRENFEPSDERAKKFILDLIGIRILPIKDYLKNEDFEYVIYNLGGNIDDYNKFIEFSRMAAEKESRGEMVEIDDILGIKKGEEQFEETLNRLSPDLDEKSEKRDSLKVFETSIKQMLVSADKDILEDYNLALMELITDDVKFKRDLENSLYHNNELLTTSKFKLGEKEEKPTIGNWLKDFIKRVGTKNFSNVTLMDYLTKNANTKNLYTNERVLLSKLLQLYRNLKFFPESQKGLREENWEIIPAEEIKETKIGHRSIGVPKTEAEKNIEKLEEESKDFEENSLEKLAIEEAIDKEKKIEELRFMATKFAEDSLEKKAIEEEIKKMEHEK